ncbi:carbohydrate-binding protein [Streptomyces sp. NPDC020719]|uniref:carbohydrate-binding protein n=1 Tax=Streptomyces sp. NPDC020719 TaxID=3154896 RepID=UPI0033FAEE2C
MNRHLPIRGARSSGSTRSISSIRSTRSLRAVLAAALLVVAAALGTLPGAGTAAARPLDRVGAAPLPDAPHRGTVAHARVPGHDAGRDKAVKALKDGRSAHRRTSAADLTHNWWGIFPQPGTHDGITATHSVDPAYHVTGPDNFTYAPTTKAQNSCIEVVTAYWNSGNELWAWDWCSQDGGPAKILPIDADFRTKYTSTVDGRPSFSIQLVKDAGSGNRWSSYLYNYASARWELLYRQSGTDQSGLDYGWDIFEIYASTDPATGVGYFCTEAKNTVFDSSAIQLRRNGAWSPARPADSPWTEADPAGRDFLCPPLKFLQAGANDHWTVRQ